MSNVTVRKTKCGAWEVYVDDTRLTCVRSVELDPGGMNEFSTVRITMCAEDFNVADGPDADPVKINTYPGIGFRLEA